MTMRQWTRVALVLALGTSACASHERDKPSFGKREPGALVRVRNHNFADITLYVVQFGSRWRLGTVTGMSSHDFRLPSSSRLQTGEIRILADPIGGAPTFLSPPVLVSRGQEMELLLNASLQLSSLAVWNR